MVVNCCKKAIDKLIFSLANRFRISCLCSKIGLIFNQYSSSLKNGLTYY